MNLGEIGMVPRDDAATVDLKVRMKEPLRARLEAAAEARGISMNAEAVQRLERSFDRSDLFSETLSLAFGTQAAGIVIMMANAMTKAGQMAAILATPQNMIAAQTSWVDSPYAFDQAIAAAHAVLEGLRPEGEIELPAVLKGTASFDGSWVGVGCANTEMDAAIGRSPTAALRSTGELYDRLLGPLVERLRPTTESDNAR